MKIDIILVTYNSEKYINKCISSILNSDYNLKNVGIYVYDNNSNDNSVKILNELKEKNQDKLNEFKIIESSINYGFGVANNKASKYATGEYLFFLNVDCEIYKDTLSKIEKRILNCNNDNIGIYELRQEIYEHPKYYNPINGETKWASGACMIMPTKIFKKVKGFDKKIFLYCEDVEISFKIRKLGYKIIYFNDIPIIHYSYSKAYEFKRSQYTNSVPNNLYLRLKYGTVKDIIKGYFLYLLFYKEISLNDQIKDNDVESIKKEIKKNKNKMLLRGIIEWIKRIRFIFNKNKIKFDFMGFDYSATKDAPFYQIKEIKNHPLVSIIVRTCNRPCVLRETLISLRNQTYKNIEIVIVEDGQDISRKMIKEEFSDLNIKYFAFGKKVGRCKAGNKALSMASGKYLNFLDDDDLFYDDHVSVLVGELENSKEKIAYATSFETSIIVHSKKPYNYQITGERNGISTEFSHLKILYNNITPIQCVMFDREVYEKCGGFDEELDALEDWDLWIKYSLEYPFKYVKRTTSIYRVPAQEKDAKNREGFLNSYLDKVREKYKNKIVKANMQDVIDFYQYATLLSLSPTAARLEKIKKILKRGN